MVLILLLESKSTNTDFFRKVIGYQIFKTHANLVSGYSLLSPSLLVQAILAILTMSADSTAFFLVIVTSVEIAKIDTNFLTFFEF